MSIVPSSRSGSVDEVVEALGSPAFVAFRHQADEGADASAALVQAFDAARRRYLAGQRMDIKALARELGVSRPTLYRWTGGREQLLSDVLFSYSDESFVWSQHRTAHLAGSERLIACFREHVGALVRARPLQVFLQQETQAALRILTSRDSSVQLRTVVRLADFYREEVRAGHFTPRADLETLAYAVVKLTDAFIYNDALAAVEPQVDRAAEVVALLLRE